MPTAATRTVNVWRNHAIEGIWSLGKPFMHFGGWQAEARLSDYDDSLGFANHVPADLELIWLDSGRYLQKVSFDDWLEWLVSRLKALRSLSKAPVIVATWVADDDQARSLRESFDALPGCHFADLWSTARETSQPLIDPRASAVSGSVLNPRLHAAIARELACHWLPAALFPPIKVLALDLDNTLHDGVLGEDGPAKVLLTEQHQQLQQQLLELRRQGILLALISRNELADVEELFALRADYPLRWSDFSAIEVSWGRKANALQRVASTLRVGLDAVLFVDDNPGELLAVSAELPQVHGLLADAPAMNTGRAIFFYPGLWRWRADDVGHRQDDLRANAQREALRAGSTTTGDYFHSLGVTLTVRSNPADQLKRLADLCIKTNQFNLSLRRMTEAEIAEFMAREDACVSSAALSDRLADSGVIAAVAAHREAKLLVVDELCVSCRAMGRGLEDAIVICALKAMPQFDGCDAVCFHAAHGPRNQPALDWLANMLGHDARLAEGIHVVTAEALRRFQPPAGLDIRLP